MVSLRPFVAVARSGNDHCPRLVRITIGRRWAAWHGDRTSELTRMVNVRTPRGRPRQAIPAPRQAPQWRRPCLRSSPWNSNTSRRGGRDQVAASGGQSRDHRTAQPPIHRVDIAYTCPTMRRARLRLCLRPNSSRYRSAMGRQDACGCRFRFRRTAGGCPAADADWHGRSLRRAGPLHWCGWSARCRSECAQGCASEPQGHRAAVAVNAIRWRARSWSSRRARSWWKL